MSKTVIQYYNAHTIYAMMHYNANTAYNICHDVMLPSLVQGPFTREDGFLGYNEICAEQRDSSYPWVTEWEEHHMAPYMYKGDRWVSYDNEQSLALKVGTLVTIIVGS